MGILDLLKGGNLNSLGKSHEIARNINDQLSFDDLFNFIYYPDRVVAMRSMDTVEKITRVHPEYLVSHISEILSLFHQSSPKGFKWHLPLLISRMELSKAETGVVWDILTRWTLDKKESRIVRVNSIQTLYDLLEYYPDLQTDFKQTLDEVRKEPIPSIQARIKRFKLNFRQS